MRNLPLPRSLLSLQVSKPLLPLIVGLIFGIIGLLAASSLNTWLAAGVNGPLATVTAFLIAGRFGRKEAEAGGPKRKDRRKVRYLAIYDSSTGLLERWFFEHRLSEEIARARRYDLDLSLLTVAAPADFRGDPAARVVWVARVSSRLLQAIRAADLPATIGDCEFAVCLIHCDRAGAEAFARRLSEDLGDTEVQIGIASVPEYTGGAKAMIEVARRRLSNEAA